MGFADFDIMGKCKTIIEKVEELATNLSEVKTSANGAKTSADTAASNTSVIGATGNTGGSATAGTVMGKLNKLITDLTTHMGRWTNTRAGYIDNIRSYTITNNTASKTGVLSAKLAYVISLLENTTYGLSALKTASSSSVIKSVQRGISATVRNGSTDITIAAVSMQKAFVNIQPYLTSTETTVAYGSTAVVGTLVSSTTLRIGADTANYVSWEVIEFV